MLLYGSEGWDNHISYLGGLTLTLTECEFVCVAQRVPFVFWAVNT
jgi:hypothetical protein